MGFVHSLWRVSKPNRNNPHVRPRVRESVDCDLNESFSLLPLRFGSSLISLDLSTVDTVWVLGPRYWKSKLETKGCVSSVGPFCAPVFVRVLFSTHGGKCEAV